MLSWRGRYSLLRKSSNVELHVPLSVNFILAVVSHRRVWRLRWWVLVELARKEVPSTPTLCSCVVTSYPSSCSISQVGTPYMRAYCVVLMYIQVLQSGQVGSQVANKSFVCLFVRSDHNFQPLSQYSLFTFSLP